MKFLACIAALSLMGPAYAETQGYAGASDGYYALTLEDDCGCDPSTYDFYVKYGEGKFERYSLYYAGADGRVLIPKTNDDLPMYKRITGVSAVTKARRPTPTRLTKLCPGMPYLPEQAHWAKPADGDVIPMYCG